MIRDLFRTALTMSAVGGLTTTLGPAAIAVSMADPRYADRLIQLYGRTLLSAAGVRPAVRGLENLPRRTAVYVCNHQSHFDALMLVAFIPRHLRFVAKSELFEVPLFGHALAATGNLKVERSNSERDKKVLADAVKAVQERVNVLFFPEGTRSDDGVLKPFKKGASIMAIDAQVPIVPMAVGGTRHILPKGSKWVRGGRRATLIVGKPIPTEGLTHADRDALTERHRAAVAALLEQAEALAERG